MKDCLENITINSGFSIVIPFDVSMWFSLNVLFGRVKIWDLDYCGVGEDRMYVKKWWNECKPTDPRWYFKKWISIKNGLVGKRG